jgi:hypothetical protein
MPRATTRSSVSSLATFSSPSVTTRSAYRPFYVSHVLALTFIRLNKLLGDVVISQGGVVPFIQPELLPNATKKGKKADDPSQEV